MINIKIIEDLQQALNKLNSKSIMNIKNQIRKKILMLIMMNENGLELNI